MRLHLTFSRTTLIFKCNVQHLYENTDIILQFYCFEICKIMTRVKIFFMIIQHCSVVLMIFLKICISVMIDDNKVIFNEFAL